MNAVYLIDGYNLMYRVPRVRDTMRTDFEAAREELIVLVIGFCTASGNRVKIVFDGRGERQEASMPPMAGRGVEVIFAPNHLTADAVIERMVYQSGARQAYVVVTGDRGIRDLCQHMGAFVMTPENFLTSLKEAQTSLRQAADVEKLHKIETVEDRLDTDSLARLRALKDKLTGK